MTKYLSEFGETPTAICYNIDMYRTTPSEGLAWLAGIIEGEGSIANYPPRHNKAYPTGNGGYNRGIVIVNTDEKILNRCKQIYDYHNIHYGYTQKSASRNQREGSFIFTKPCYELAVRRLEDLQYIIPKLLPHIIGEKKPLLEKLLKDIEGKRITKPRVTTERETPVLLGEATV